MADDPRQGPIHDEYGRDRAGVPISFGDDARAEPPAAPPRWPLATWLGLLAAFGLGLAFAFPVSALAEGEPAPRPTNRPGNRSPVHLRAEDM